MKNKTLKDLNKDEIGYIDYIELEDSLKNRLYALGFIKGEKISVLYKGVNEEIIAYQIRGTCIALRVEESEKIFIVS